MLVLGTRARLLTRSHFRLSHSEGSEVSGGIRGLPFRTRACHHSWSHVFRVPRTRADARVQCFSLGFLRSCPRDVNRAHFGALEAACFRSHPCSRPVRLSRRRQCYCLRCLRSQCVTCLQWSVAMMLCHFRGEGLSAPAPPVEHGTQVSAMTRSVQALPNSLQKKRALRPMGPLRPRGSSMEAAEVSDTDFQGMACPATDCGGLAWDTPGRHCSRELRQQEAGRWAGRCGARGADGCPDLLSRFFVSL